MKAIVSRYESCFAIIEQLIDKLFAPDNRRLQTWIDKLDAQNREARGDNNLFGFVYLGRYYRPSHIEGPDPTGVRPVDPSMHLMVEAFLADERLVEDDKQLLRQGLYNLLSPCTDMQGIRDALPDFLADLIPECKELPRDRGECWTFDSNPHPRARHQFEKVRAKLESYAAARMIF